MMMVVISRQRDNPLFFIFIFIFLYFKNLISNVLFMDRDTNTTSYKY